MEFRESHLEIARSVPLDRLDPTNLMQSRSGAGKPLYVICQSGGRGRQACEKFRKAGFKNVLNVEGGMAACLEAGLPAVRGKKTISLERQVRIAAGSLVLLGIVLAWLVHPAFVGLAAFVGGGLVFAGVTDTCGMGMILAHAMESVRVTRRHLAACTAVIRQVGWRRYDETANCRWRSRWGLGRRPARRLAEDAHIILFERGPDVSFANCGLPYYIGGEIVDRKKLLVTTPERLRARFNLDVRTLTSVEAIDRARKTLRVRELNTGREYEEAYDKLILALGATPVRPPISGIDLQGIFTLRTMQDMDRIKDRADRGVRQAVVIGAGFIGLELVENFVRRGIATTVIELQDQVLPPFDKEMTTPINQTLESHGVSIMLGDSAESFEQTADGLLVHLKSGRRVPAQLVILGVGVRPESKLAADAGLEVGPRGGIRVNDFLQTSDPDIYAVGDAIETKDFISGDRTQMPLAGPANRQGRIAADNCMARRSAVSGNSGNGHRRGFRLHRRINWNVGEGPATKRPRVSHDLCSSAPSRWLLSRSQTDDG